LKSADAPDVEHLQNFTGGAVNIAAVPEPSLIMLLIAGVGGLALRRRRII